MIVKARETRRVTAKRWPAGPCAHALFAGAGTVKTWATLQHAVMGDTPLSLAIVVAPAEQAAG